jgi:hypothetical protein
MGFEIVVIFRQRAALVSPHCFPTHAPCRNRGVYHLRLPHIKIKAKTTVGRGGPCVWRVTRMNKMHAAGLSIFVSRAGDASARKAA